MHVYRRARSPYWWLAYLDPTTGQRARCSLGTADEAQGRDGSLEEGPRAVEAAAGDLAAAGLTWREAATGDAVASPWEAVVLAAIGRCDLAYDRPTTAPRLAALASCSTQLVWAAAAAGDLRPARRRKGDPGPATYRAASCRAWLAERGVVVRLRDVDDGAAG